MRGAIPSLPQYTFMTWCSVKAQGQLYIFTFLAEWTRHAEINSEISDELKVDDSIEGDITCRNKVKIHVHRMGERSGPNEIQSCKTTG